MDSTGYASGRLTAYFQNDTNGQKAQQELLSIGVPPSAVVLQTLETGGHQDALDALNRLFGSEFGPYDEGSILTVEDPEHGAQILATIERFGGEVHVRHAQGDIGVDSPVSSDTQSSGNP